MATRSESVPSTHREVKYLVEATRFEQTCLQEKWEGRIAWDDRVATNLTQGAEVGQVEGQPVIVHIAWVRLGGNLVGFYRPATRIVDYGKIEAWLTETFPTRNRTIAEDFPKVLRALKLIG